MELVIGYKSAQPNSPSIFKLIATAALLLSPILLPAENQRDYPPKDPVPLKSDFTTNKAAPHVGNSPLPPRAEGDTRFVVDQSPGLDTICTFRADGPLVIELPVKRYVGAVKPDGTLQDPAGLIAKGYISATAKLRMPAEDIDQNGQPRPEVDRIFFNGTDIGILTGKNNAWKINEFEVPIALVKFPALGPSGSTPIPAINTIEVHIDEASPPGDDSWCMSLDWIEIEFNAIAPIFLVHGTNAQSDTWDPHFTTFFAGEGIPWSNDINLEANGSIQGNGKLLAVKALSLASFFGAKKCHIIAHSKGGLDTRAYLGKRYLPKLLQVMSVYTLSTPHHGTIISDIIVEGRKATKKEIGSGSPNPDIAYLLRNDYSYASTPQSPAIDDQTTKEMATFNQDNPGLPVGIHFYNFGADADLNNNTKIEIAEANEMFPGGVAISIQVAAGTAMYRAIRNITTIKVDTITRTNFWGEYDFTSITATSAASGEENDLVTSVTSSKAPGGTYLLTLDHNHSSMKSEGVARAIIDRILRDFPN